MKKASWEKEFDKKFMIINKETQTKHIAPNVAICEILDFVFEQISLAEKEGLEKIEECDGEKHLFDYEETKCQICGISSETLDKIDLIKKGNNETKMPERLMR